MNIQSHIYRGYEIVQMPSGVCLIHEGNRDGKLLSEQSSLMDAMTLINELSILIDEIEKGNIQ